MQKQTTYGQTWHAGAVAHPAHGRFVCCYASAIDDGDGFDEHAELTAPALDASGVGTTTAWIRSSDPPAKAMHQPKTNVATNCCHFDCVACA